MSIIFDCDGVLVDSERLVCRIEADLLSAWGWPCTPQQHREAFKGRTFLDMARAIQERLAERLPVDWMYQWAMAQANGFRAELREVRGVRPLIEELLADGQVLCVASQPPPGRVRLSLELCDLARYFGPRVFTASLVAHPKPAPDLFLYAAAQLGIAPERCTVIEDSPSGVRAAVAAGMRVFGYAADEDGERLAAAGALTFTDMAELRALIQTASR